jgi:hypothetical protein
MGTYQGFALLGSSRVISARTVEGMIRVGRVAVKTDVAAVAAQLDLPLGRVLARFAQTLQLASDKRGPITPVRLDMIDDIRRRHNPALKAELAQRMLHQLEPAEPSPARGAGVPSIVARL